MYHVLGLGPRCKLQWAGGTVLCGGAREPRGLRTEATPGRKVPNAKAQHSAFRLAPTTPFASCMQG
jgi:hypothetical protein